DAPMLSGVSIEWFLPNDHTIVCDRLSVLLDDGLRCRSLVYECNGQPGELSSPARGDCVGDRLRDGCWEQGDRVVVSRVLLCESFRPVRNSAIMLGTPVAYSKRMPRCEPRHDCAAVD